MAEAEASPRYRSHDVADFIVAQLAALGVEYVFGVPGGAIEPLFNALARSARNGGPRAVVARHEAGAAFMADGYARETGRLGVCCATSGPGATNLITGLACAFENNIPLLAITGQPALTSFGRRALQEMSCSGIDLVAMLRHTTRYSSLVSHPSQIPAKFGNAVSKALQLPNGPCHLNFPVDILRSPVTPALGNDIALARLLGPNQLLDPVATARLADELTRARNPVFLLGAGSQDAVPAILALARRLNALLVTTPDAKGYISPRLQRYRGVYGFAGHGSAEATLRNRADLIVAIGISLGEWTSASWSPTVLNDRLIHVDCDNDHLMRSPMARMHVGGSILAVFEHLLELMPDAAIDTPPQAGAEQITLRNPDALLDEPDKLLSDATPIKPQRLMRELSRRCLPDTRFLADSGNSIAWAIHCLKPNESSTWSDGESGERQVDALHRRRPPSWFHVVMDFAPMGWAIGAAVGLARANPHSPVICLTGDGSYLMNGQEITVAAAEQLPVVFVILNDAALGMVRHGQRLSGAESIGWEMPAVDFAAMAAAMGIPGYRVHSPEDFEAIDFLAIQLRKGPTLIDVYIDPNEVPPMRLRLKALGTAR